MIDNEEILKRMLGAILIFIGLFLIGYSITLLLSK